MCWKKYTYIFNLFPSGLVNPKIDTSLMLNPSVEPNKTLFTIAPNRIIENARFSIAKNMPLYLLTKKPSINEIKKHTIMEIIIRNNASFIDKKLTEVTKSRFLKDTNLRQRKNVVR